MEQNLLESLFALQDLKYKEFHCRLMPTVDPETVIGVRVPLLRKLAVQFGKTPQAEAFLHALPHRYYEENNVHGCLISAMTDYEQTVAALDAFLPYVDNWATCDLISPKAFKKHPAPLLEQCRTWMASDHAYTVRFGIGVLLSFYLDDAFAPEQTAWYFATALAKQYDAALPYIQHQRLDPWTHNKAIQKAVESYRITPEQKDLLRKYKVKL